MKRNKAAKQGLLNGDVTSLFNKHGFTIIATIDETGTPHTACKGIVKVGPGDMIYLLDLYRARTFNNLKTNKNVSMTIVDDHSFKGYCLKGEAHITEKADLDPAIIKAWEERMSARITKRIVRNVQADKEHKHVHEVHLPKPEYLIAVRVTRVVDLVPAAIADKGGK